MEKESDCIKVNKRVAEKLRKILLSSSLLRKDLKPKSFNDEVLFPVVNIKKALSIATSLGIEAEPCEETFEAYLTRKILKEEALGLSSYTLIGNIAIISRGRDHGISLYKKLAEKIMIMHPNVKAVYLKQRTVGTYRLPELTLLAGENVTETEFKEYGLRFRVDITKAYANPRLAEEHRRLAEIVEEGEKVLDMFSGIAPFAIHIASLKRAEVLATDINPYASYYAAMNVKLNLKKLKGKVLVMKADAKDLPYLLRPSFTRVIMNSPKNSLSFLGEACNLLSKQGFLHIYVIAESDRDLISDVEKRLRVLRCEINDVKVRRVKEYSPFQKIFVVDVYVQRLLP